MEEAAAAEARVVERLAEARREVGAAAEAGAVAAAGEVLRVRVESTVEDVSGEGRKEARVAAVAAVDEGATEVCRAEQLEVGAEGVSAVGSAAAMGAYSVAVVGRRVGGRGLLEGWWAEAATAVAASVAAAVQAEVQAAPTAGVEEPAAAEGLGPTESSPLARRSKSRSSNLAGCSRGSRRQAPSSVRATFLALPGPTPRL